MLVSPEREPMPIPVAEAEAAAKAAETPADETPANRRRKDPPSRPP